MTICIPSMQVELGAAQWDLLVVAPLQPVGDHWWVSHVQQRTSSRATLCTNSQKRLRCMFWHDLVADPARQLLCIHVRHFSAGWQPSGW